MMFVEVLDIVKVVILCVLIEMNVIFDDSYGLFKGICVMVVVVDYGVDFVEGDFVVFMCDSVGVLCEDLCVG